MVTRLLPIIAYTILALSGCVGKPDLSMRPALMQTLKEWKEIRILYDPLMVIDHLTVVSRSSGKYTRYYEVHDDYLPFQDPLAGVQSQFAAGLTTRLGLHNISTANRVEPRSEHPHSLEELTLDRGLVFQFDTQNWQVIREFFTYAPPPGTTLPARYILKYSAQGTLFQNRETTLLWKAHCKVSLTFEAPVDILLEKELADENSLLHGKRKEVETHCAEELLEKFFP